jgi:hypothetical protein
VEGIRQALEAQRKVEQEALHLLAESFPMRPDLKASAAGDSDLVALRGNARFQALVKA